MAIWIGTLGLWPKSFCLTMANNSQKGSLIVSLCMAKRAQQVSGKGQ